MSITFDDKVRFIASLSKEAKAAPFGELFRTLLAGKAVRHAPKGARIAQKFGRTGALSSMWKHYPVRTALTGVGTGYGASRMLGSRQPRQVNVTKY